MPVTPPFLTFPPHTTTPPSPTTTSFSLKPPFAYPTDVWRAPGPPCKKSFNTPIIYKSLSLSSFKRARVTVSGNWALPYDQGGLIFVLQTDLDIKETKWIKTGIELVEGETYVSAVVADNWSDWSLTQTGIKDGKEVTLEMERLQSGALMIYVIDGDKKKLIRKIPWVSSEFSVVQVWVGVYAASPNVEGRTSEFEVKFKGWEFEYEG